MTLLEVTHLSKRFSNGTDALLDISFAVKEGEFLVISGKNGSGKSVLMRHLIGLYKPDSGKILFRGVSLSKNILAVRQKIGIVFQNPENQIVSQTVKRDVAFGPENLHMDKEHIEQRVTDALDKVGLLNKYNHSTRTLSGGEKRRLAIAGILAMKPDIIILDEPFSNLDFPGVTQILRHIVHLHTTGHTVICITHELEKVLYHADRLIIMDNGKIVCNNTPVNLLDKIPEYGIYLPGNSKEESPSSILKRMSWLK